jgi:hypothetical protein
MHKFTATGDSVKLTTYCELQFMYASVVILYAFNHRHQSLNALTCDVLDLLLESC